MALTENQRKFVDLYWEAIEAGVKPSEARLVAKQGAGYSDATSYRDIINESVVTEMLAQANQRMILGLPTAINKLESVMDDPTQDAAKILIDVTSIWMDRAGIIKKEAKEVTIKSPTGIVILPAKKELDEIIGD